jgi:pimeloyl-ACP methyl ester carboxylesterase
MRLDIESRGVFAADGGNARIAGRELVIFLHGAGMDHSVWVGQSRWLAHHGFNVLAVDFPGHGRSEGPPLAEIGALADWTARLIAAAGVSQAALAGHSMGALVALETAARHPVAAASLTLIGVGGAMPVHPELLRAARANAHDAIDMVSLWSLGAHATQGGSPSPGLWMLGGAERLLERAADGVLHADLAACDAYRVTRAAAERIRCPTTVILGERDRMTPPEAGKALAASIRDARTIIIPDAGHMLMIERPDEVRQAIRDSLSRARSQGARAQGHR